MLNQIETWPRSGQYLRPLAFALALLSGCTEPAQSSSSSEQKSPAIDSAPASSSSPSAQGQGDARSANADASSVLSPSDAAAADASRVDAGQSVADAGGTTLDAASGDDSDAATEDETPEDDTPLGEPVPEADAFMGTLPDAPLRQALIEQGIKAVERGRGGRSLGFKITLESGQKAYFKAEQTFSAANWFGEVAAYHLDRMLGLGRVPLVVSREFDWSQLDAAAGKDKRREEIIIHDGKVRGAFVAWVDGGLQPLKQDPGWERWVRVKYWPSTAVTPFQRPIVWKKQLDQVRKMGNDWRSKQERFKRRNLNPEPDREDRPSELSDLIVFDYLTRNLDRWGGNNANVLIRGKNGPLVFLDNGAGFEPGEHRPSLMEARLHVVQRFRRSTIRAVRGFSIDRFKERLLNEPVQPVLTSWQVRGLRERRKALLEWVAEMEGIYGEAIWAWE